MIKPPVQKIYEFEKFRFDTAHLMLYQSGEEISLAPKAAQTLLILIERRSEILSKDELMKTIWKDSIVEETNLTQYIHILRKTLGTAANGKPLIETLRQRGYRFNGDVKIVENKKKDIPAELVSETHIADKPKPNRRFLLKTIALAAIAGVLILVVSAFLKTKNTAAPAITLKRLTPDRNIIQPTVSPDGKYLVYSVLEKDATKTLRLKDLTSNSEVQIMPSGEYRDLAFSSDGKQIFYLTYEADSANSTLMRVPLFGGKPQTVLKNVLGPPAVSYRNGKIAIIAAGSGLVILDENGELVDSYRSPDTAFSPIIWGSQMSWSPDGERIFLCGKDDKAKPQILEYLTKNRTERVFSIPNFSEIDDAAWLADNSGLLVTAKERSGEPYQIWRVTLPSGEATRITRDFNDYNWISLSADSKTLVVGQDITKTNVWLAPFNEIEKSKQLTFGSEAQDGFRGLTFAPKGKIIFTSPRSGNVDLWQINEDGSDQKTLTDNQGGLNVSPRITPDGRYIVFASSRNSDGTHIWRMDVDGQNPLQLTKGIYDERFFDVSNDGNRVFYASPNARLEMVTLQVSINGGEPSAIADNYRTSGAIAFSPDGKLLMRYIYMPENKHSWKFGIFPVEGGEPLKLLEITAFRNFVRWSADSKALLYIKPGTSQIWRQPIDGNASELFVDLKNGLLFTFAVSPDQKQIVFSRGTQFSEAILIENFQKQ